MTDLIAISLTSCALLQLRPNLVLITNPQPGATLETRTPAQQLLLQVVMASVAVKSYVVTHDER